MEIQRSHREPQEIVGLRETVRMDEISAFFARAIPATMAALTSRGEEPIGPPVAMYGEMSGDSVEVTVGFPVPASAAPSDDVIADMLPGGPTVETVYRGPYDGMREWYGDLMKQFADEHITTGPRMWEEYLVGPESGVEPKDWQTRVVFTTV
jgi:effector-binding domain-containing protein